MQGCTHIEISIFSWQALREMKPLHTQIGMLPFANVCTIELVDTRINNSQYCCWPSYLYLLSPMTPLFKNNSFAFRQKSHC